MRKRLLPWVLSVAVAVWMVGACRMVPIAELGIASAGKDGGAAPAASRPVFGYVPTPTGTGFVHVTAGKQDTASAKVNLAAAADVTGILPAGNQAAQSLGGDLSGTSAAATVAKVNGTSVPAGGALTTGTVLRASGVASSSWGALDLSSASAVTGILPQGNQAQQTLGGDLSGATASATVAKVNGAAWPASGTLAQGDVAYYNGTAWVRLAAGTSGNTLTTAGAGANPAWGLPTGGTFTYNTYVNRPGSPTSGDRFVDSDTGRQWLYAGAAWRPVMAQRIGRQPPAAASWTVFNSIGTPTLVDDGAGGLVVTAGQNETNSTTLRGFYLAATDHVTMTADFSLPADNLGDATHLWPLSCLFMLESSSNKATIITVRYGDIATTSPKTMTTLVFDRWTYSNYTNGTRSDSSTSTAVWSAGAPVITQLRTNPGNGNIEPRVSSDGVNWIALASTAKTGIFTTAPNRMGVCWYSYNSATPPTFAFHDFDYL